MKIQIFLGILTLTTHLSAFANSTPIPIKPGSTIEISGQKYICESGNKASGATFHFMCICKDSANSRTDSNIGSVMFESPADLAADDQIALATPLCQKSYPTLRVYVSECKSNSSAAGGSGTWERSTLSHGDAIIKAEEEERAKREKP